jgi:hypothetical protein
MLETHGREAMAADQKGAIELGIIAEAVKKLFHIAKWLSVMHWLSFWNARLRSRSELVGEEITSPELVKRRGRTIELYILGWLAVEVSLVVVSSLGSLPPLVGFLFAVVVSVRILEIVQVTVNVTLFDAFMGRSDGTVSSRIRTLVLAGVNFVELFLCFGIIYATNYKSLMGAGRPITGFYLSIITQLTIGYGDVYPTSWMRLVAAIQGLVGIVFVVLVFGRVIASFQPLKEVFGQD